MPARRWLPLAAALLLPASAGAQPAVAAPPRTAQDSIRASILRGAQGFERGDPSLILDHYDLARYFDELTGASEDEVRSAKADVVEEALRRLRLRGADLTRPVMVGDRHHDVVGAAAHEVPTIYVTWGYGAPEETVGTVAVVDTAAQLRAELGLAELGLGGA